MYCTECGRQLAEEASYCPECGTARPDREASDAEKEQNQSEDEGPELNEIPEKMGRIDKKSPPHVSVVTILFAIIGLILILVLLNPWHSGQDKPEDFQGTRNNTESIQF